MTDINVPDQLLATAYNQSDAAEFGEVAERALFLYIVLENPEQILTDHDYYERHAQSDREAGSR